MDVLGLSKEQLDLIEDFEADYNAVDQFLRKTLGSDKLASFTHLVNQYEQKHRGWRRADLLKSIGEVRNTIVHGKTAPYCYLAVPTPALAKDLKSCREGLINPIRVIPTFQREVESLSIDDTLAQVLRTIKQRDYSQFPVYATEQFQGLLTENGITRWLAHHVATDLSLVEMDDVSVKQLLQSEEKRKNYHFVSRNTIADDAKGLFTANELLEAVLITASGKESETLMGIATRWDMIRLT